MNKKQEAKHCTTLHNVRYDGFCICKFHSLSTISAFCFSFAIFPEYEPYSWDRCSFIRKMHTYLVSNIERSETDVPRGFDAKTDRKDGCEIKTFKSSPIINC